MELTEVKENLSKELGIPVKEIERIYKAYWKAVYDIMTTMPLDDTDSLDSIKHSISILPIGKLYIGEPRFKFLKELYAEYKED